MSEWKEYRLGDILSIKSGFSYKGKYIGTGESLLLGMGCVSFREKFLMSGARPYSGPYDDRYKVYPGDIVLATRQQSDNLPILAMPAMVPNSLEGKDIVIGTNLYKVEITEKSFPNDYIYWLLKTKRYVNYIAGVKTGTTVSMVTKKNVEDFTFFASTNPEERKEIASVIAFLDDKIAVNRRICENLEAQAQALFKHWFIDFAPFKNGTFVESELGMIPEGWRVGTLGEICSFSKNKIAIESLDETTYYSTENMLSNKAGAENASSLPQVGITTGCLPYDVLISNIRPYFKKIIRVTKECGCSADVLCFRSKESKYKSFMYRVLYDDLFFAYVVAGSKGTKMPRGDKSQIMKYPLAIPSDSVLEDYSNNVEPMFEIISSLKSENLRLSTLRDSLLPKLMSGQIKL